MSFHFRNIKKVSTPQFEVSGDKIKSMTSMRRNKNYQSCFVRKVFGELITRRRHRRHGAATIGRTIIEGFPRKPLSIKFHQSEAENEDKRSSDGKKICKNFFRAKFSFWFCFTFEKCFISNVWRPLRSLISCHKISFNCGC